jgi:hypothetical protein
MYFEKIKKNFEKKDNEAWNPRYRSDRAGDERSDVPVRHTIL